MAGTLTSVSAVKDVAAYISTLADTPAESTIPGDTENGRRLYTSCGACHGKRGQGVWSVNAPRLAGTQDWYLRRQINNFKDGVRGTHPADAAGKQMMLLSGMLKNDQAINDVIAYINTLR
jgi:cytochrome c oxidase subunit 2